MCYLDQRPRQTGTNFNSRHGSKLFSKKVVCNFDLILSEVKKEKNEKRNLICF